MIFHSTFPDVSISEKTFGDFVLKTALAQGGHTVTYAQLAEFELTWR